METLALIQHVKRDLSLMKQDLVVEREHALKEFESLCLKIKTKLTKVAEEQQQNRQLQELLITVQRESSEKDEDLSNKDAEIDQLQAYIEKNRSRVGRVSRAWKEIKPRVVKVAGLIRKRFVSDKKSTSK